MKESNKMKMEITEELIKFIERNQNEFEAIVDFTKSGKLIIIIHEQ